MTLQVATGNHIKQGAPYMLGGYDSLYVAQGAVVANTEDMGMHNWPWSRSAATSRSSSTAR